VLAFAKRAPHRPPHEAQATLIWAFTITKVVGDNFFELSIPPFLGLHPIFNVELLQPYFPPLLDTLKVAKKFSPT
jgi:hypothetical protein